MTEAADHLDSLASGTLPVTPPLKIGRTFCSCVGVAVFRRTCPFCFLLLFPFLLDDAVLIVVVSVLLDTCCLLLLAIHKRDGFCVEDVASPWASCWPGTVCCETHRAELGTGALLA